VALREAEARLSIANRLAACVADPRAASIATVAERHQRMNQL
jgi:hypothetical protein